MDSDDDGFAKQGGEALDIGGVDDSEEENDDESGEEMPTQAQNKPISSGQKPAGGNPEVKGQKIDNQPFDLAVDVNDSEEIESEEEEDRMNVDMDVGPSAAQNKNVGPQHKGVPKRDPEDEDDDDDEKEVPGAYNPQQFANLPVSSEVKELFEYIQRYKPQKIDLETKLKPFVPEYIPAVGEVDAFLKMPKPDGTKEDLGIAVLDEPALNHEDKTVLELKYVQSKNVVRAAPMDVDSIESADKKPKEIARWINSVADLHKSRPPPTVNYTKAMPEFDDLMREWNPDMEQALR